MTRFEASNTITKKIKWSIYILFGLAAIIYIINYSSWRIFFKILVSIPLLINLIFDLVYFNKEKFIISHLKFENDLLVVVYSNSIEKKVKYSNLKYSIRKRRYYKNKTEIELKEKRGFRFKTFGRLHIKNWNNIFELEKQLESSEIQRVNWKPQTLWSKYWGIFVDLILFVLGSNILFAHDHQEKAKRQTHENMIE